MFSLCVYLGNFKILVFSNTYTIFEIFVIFGSIILYIITYAIQSSIVSMDDFNTFSPLYNNPCFWIGTFLILMYTMFPDLVIFRYQRYAKTQELAKEKKKIEEEK